MKKEIIRYSLLVFWFGVVAMVSYRMGLNHGQTTKNHVLSQVVKQNESASNVQRLTFYEKLNQPTPQAIRPDPPKAPTLATQQKPDTVFEKKPVKPVAVEKPKELLAYQDRMTLPWAVQVAAFEDGAKAVLLKKELEQKGYGAYTVPVKTKQLELFRVLVGAATHQDSELIASNLQKSGYSTSFVIKR